MSSGAAEVPFSDSKAAMEIRNGWVFIRLPEVIPAACFKEFSVFPKNTVSSKPAFPDMQRHWFLAALITGIAASGAALYPVIARDLDGFDFVDPLDLVLPAEEATAVEPSPASLELETSLAEPVAPEPVAPPEPPKPVGPVVVSTHSGEASWYGPGFYGNRTASGEVFRPGTMTAAHRSLPFGTKVRVTNLWNGRKAVVRINDRGPFVGHRVIDLGHGAAKHLGLTSSGVAQVKLEVLR